MRLVRLSNAKLRCYAKQGPSHNFSRDLDWDARHKSVASWNKLSLATGCRLRSCQKYFRTDPARNCLKILPASFSQYLVCSARHNFGDGRAVLPSGSRSPTRGHVLLRDCVPPLLPILGAREPCVHAVHADAARHLDNLHIASHALLCSFCLGGVRFHRNAPQTVQDAFKTG